MASDVGSDQLVQIRVEGMHCHKCETAIQKTLTGIDGVHEVEVDFNSGLVSVLVARSTATAGQLMDAVRNAGYSPIGFTQGLADRVGHSG